MRILGLDVGDRRIGVAISDPGEVLASPLTTIASEDSQSATDAIIRLVDQHDVKRIVVGLPYSLDGSVGGQAKKVIDFIDTLSKGTKASIETWDERLSTKAVERLLKNVDNKKANKREHRDAAAAAFILQGYLDSLKVCDQ
jgi:putative Holliday junction resolvase